MARDQLRMGAVLSYAAIAFNAVAGLVYTPWMVSCIGADDYGLYTLTMSIINFFLLDFGLGDSVSRFMSKYYAEGRSDLANRFLGVAYRIYFLMDVVVFAVLLTVFLLVDQIYGNLSPDQLDKFKVLYAVVAIYSVVSFPCAAFKGILVANEEFVPLNLINLMQKVMTVLLIVVALLAGTGVYALVAVNAGVGLLASVSKYTIIRRRTGARASFEKDWFGQVREVAGFSMWIMVAQVAQRFIFSIAPSILAAVSASWEITLFGLASTMESYVWSIANALNGIFMPRVARLLNGEKSTGGLEAFVVKAGRVQLYIVGGIVVAFFILGGRFTGCWMGEGYEALYLCVSLLVAPALLDVPLMVASTSLLAAGRAREYGLVYTVMAVINIALIVPLAASFGALGACGSICVAYLVRTGGLCVQYRRALGMRLVGMLRRIFFTWLPTAAVSAVAAAAASALLPAEGWGWFFVTCTVFLTIYFVMCWLVSFNDWEKELVRSAILRLVGRG